MGHSNILYDVSLMENPDEQLFNLNKSRNAENNAEIAGIGRAPVVFFSHQGTAMVLKHYYRGGLVAKWVRDWYLGNRLENTRAYREWCLLRTMKNLNLPVPTPVAARVIKAVMCYRADLITLELEHSRTLADWLIKAPISNALWTNIGHCIKRFHRHDIFHADLNARNILLAEIELDDNLEDRKIYLIDFDRGRIRARGTSWQTANLNRLKRSLNKFKQSQASFNFDELNWENLLQGYDAPCK